MSEVAGRGGHSEERAPDASVLIVSWNTRELLSRCLSSIGKELVRDADLRLEVIVVDNDSEDGSVAHVREAYPWVHVVENEVNSGFATASNQAARVARSDIWILLNPDSEVRPGALSALLRALSEEPEAAVLAPLLENSDGSLQHSCEPRPTLWRELLRLLHLGAVVPGAGYRMSGWSTTLRRAVDVASGACLAVRSGALGGEALFDESFFMYSEEVDLSERLRQRGWQVLWVPEARVAHHGAASTRQAEESMFLELYRSKLLFFRKHDGRLASTVYKGVLYIASGLRLMLSPLVLLERGERRDCHMRLVRYYNQLVRRLREY